MDWYEVLWILLITIPLTLIWVYAIIDLFRRDDLSNVATALWLVAIVLFPVIGTLAYLIFRPPAATPEERMLAEIATREDVSRRLSRPEQLEVLSRLHDQGKLTNEEFQREKQRILQAPEERSGVLSS